jgi:ABC-type Fe3+ transport system permease subunit
LSRKIVVAVALLALGLFAVAVVAAERSVTGGARPGRLAAGGRALRLPLGRWRWPAGVLVAGVVGLALACWTLQAPWPLAAVPARLDDAACTLGAGRRHRRLRTDELPLATPGLLTGAALVLLSTMKELPATLLLAPPGFETLTTRIWNATEDAFLADASLAALVLLLLSGTLTWFLVVRDANAPT